MTSRTTSWISRTFPYSELIRVLTHYLDLDCWVVQTGQWDQWYEIRHHKREFWPIDYDHTYGKREERYYFNNATFARVLKDKKTLCGTKNGLSAFFVPILEKGKVTGILQSGVFLREVPTRAALLRQWKELAGSGASDFNPDFLKYVRTFLETPLLEAPVYQALQEILERYARVLAGTGEAEAACERTRELSRKVFARHFPNWFWLENAVKNNRAYPPTWWLGRLRRWEREEMGIERVPTTILAIQMDKSDNPHRDALDLTLQGYRFQRELFKFSKTLPNTVAYPWGDDEALFLTSPDPKSNDVQSKLEILDKIDLVSRFADKQLRLKVLTGVSRCLRPGENLSAVLREAVTALSFCNPLNRPVLFYEDVRTNPTIPQPPDFFELSRNLIEVYTRGVVQEAEVSCSRYVEQILSQSVGKPEIVRLHFLYTCGHIVDVFRKRMPSQDGDLLFLLKELERQFQEAGTITHLIFVFRGALKRLLALATRPQASSQALRLEAVRKYIDQNFNLDLKLAAVAKDHGFSTSVFGRGFKKTVGMGFSAYVRKVRLESAKKLLVSTKLPIAQVSQECGFNNLQYFFDVFKRSTGRTPQEFRETVHVRMDPEGSGGPESP